jgi:uncharacterized protein YecE (DUF72 family)
VVVIELAPGVRLVPKELAAKRDAFFREAPGGVRYAVEVRDAGLLTRAYADVLHRHGVAHVYNYWSRMPGIAVQRAKLGLESVGFGVVRLLLPPGARYDELKSAYAPFDRLVAPQPEMRKETVELIDASIGAGDDVFVIVNNKAEGSSPLTIEALAKLLAER